MKILKNQKGQGLVEYLIIVALMGVATIAIVRTMGDVVSKRFAAISGALQGDKIGEKAPIDESSYKKKDMGNFFDGVGSNRGRGQNQNRGE